MRSPSKSCISDAHDVSLSSPLNTRGGERGQSIRSLKPQSSFTPCSNVGIRMVDEVKARMDFQGFEIMMKRAMKTFVQNRLAAVNGMNEDQVTYFALAVITLCSGQVLPSS